MIPGITTVCFAATYAATLGLEISGFYFSSRLRRSAMFAFLVAGLVAHTLYLVVRATEAGASPLSSPHDWYLLAAWLLVLLYTSLAINYPQLAVGLFVLPLVLGLIGAAQFADPQPFAPMRASRFWGNVHGTFLLLGTVSVIIGFAAGIMYLIQSYRLKNKLPPAQGFFLPSLEWLERINSRALSISAIMIAVGFLSGIVLNRIKHPGQTGVLPWSDPLVVSSAAMFLWLFIAEVFRLTYRAARQGRKVAYLTVATFFFLAISLAVLLFVDTRHGPIKSPETKRNPDSSTGRDGLDPSEKLIRCTGPRPVHRVDRVYPAPLRTGRGPVLRLLGGLFVSQPPRARCAAIATSKPIHPQTPRGARL